MAARFIAQLAVAAVAAMSVGLGVGITPAAADDLAAPKLQSLRVEGTEGFVTFQDMTEGEGGFLVTVRERDNPDRIILNGARLPGAGAPGRMRILTQRVGALPPGVPVCAQVSAWGMSTGEGVAQLAGLETVSPLSNSVCSDPATTRADLALENIRGKAEQQWTTIQNQAPAYLIAFRNTEADATGITVDISTSGVATLGDQGVAGGGWSALGFACAPRPPSGGENAALRCTGGALAAGQAGNPAVVVKFTRPGQGTIHARISGGADSNSRNNGTSFGVRVL